MDFSKTIIRRLAPAAAALVVFFVVSAAYFAPQFRGEVLPQHDVVQYEGMAKDISDMRAATGEDPQWTGGMFGGMPAYLINAARMSLISLAMPSYWMTSCWGSASPRNCGAK